MKDYKSTYMWKEINEAERVVKEFRAANADVIAAVVKATEEKGVRNICLSARGTSDHAMYFFKYAVEIMTRYTAGYVAPSVVTMYGGKTDFGGTLFIGCSQSGRAADVIATVEQARRQGAVTVAVTNDQSSPLAKAAQFHIYLNAGKEISVAATKTFTAQCYAMLSLAVALAHREGDYADLYKAVGRYVVEADALTEKEAARLFGIKDGFVLARGITYAIAFESALKLQETSKVRMRGYAMSDFYHGPMEMVSPGTHVIIYAPHSDNPDLMDDRKKCIERMLGYDADVTLVTDSAELAKYDKAHVSLFSPAADEYEIMFAFALYAQMLACRVSCAAGLDPDNPKALKKVTITR